MNSLGRPARPTYLRLSITERCNLRCRYCRPESGTAEEGAFPAADERELLNLVRLIDDVTELDKIRLSGGEPLLHPGITDWVAQLRTCFPRAKLALTTNGVLLADRAAALRQSGLDGINISLDSLDPDRFAESTGGGSLEATLRGIHAAAEAGVAAVKINTVLIRHINGEGLVDLVRFAAGVGSEIRFIELMPIGQGADLSRSSFLSTDEALDALRRSFPYLGPAPQSGTATRHRFDVGGHTATVGMISPVSHPFCSRCNRLRMDRGGRLHVCLRQSSCFDLLTPLRAGDEPAVRQYIRKAVHSRQIPGPEWPERHMVTIGG